MLLVTKLERAISEACYLGTRDSNIWYFDSLPDFSIWYQKSAANNPTPLDLGAKNDDDHSHKTLSN